MLQHLVHARLRSGEQRGKRAGASLSPKLRGKDVRRTLHRERLAALGEYPLQLGDHHGLSEFARRIAEGITHRESALGTLHDLGDGHHLGVAALYDGGRDRDVQPRKHFLVAGGNDGAAVRALGELAHVRAEDVDVPAAEIAVVRAADIHRVQPGGDEGDLHRAHRRFQHAFEVGDIPLPHKRLAHLVKQRSYLFVHLIGTFCVIKAGFGEFRHMRLPRGLQ